MSIKSFCALLCGIIVLSIGCSRSTVEVAGGGIDVENGMITGRLVDGSTGSPSAYATVTLRKVAVDPVLSGTAIRDTADVAGSYAFEQIPVGVYTLLAFSQDNAGLGLRCSISVTTDQPVELGYDTLEHPGAVALQLSDSGFEVGGYIYIPGTDLSWDVDADDIKNKLLTISPVPANIRIPFFAYSDPASLRHRIIGLDIEALEDDTIEVDCEDDDTLEIEEEKP
jgi:hypothetical protein